MKYSRQAYPDRIALAALAALFPCSAAMAQDDVDELFELSPFYVQSSEGYSSPVTTGASLFAQEIFRTPVQIDVLTSQFMEDIGAQTINEALQYATNVRPGVQSSPENEQGYSIRGLRSDRPTRNFLQITRPADRYNIESADVLQGPAAIQYGRPDPGGLINLRSKVPSFANHAHFTLQYGAWENKRATVDLNAHSGKHAIRFNGLWKETDGFRVHEGNSSTAGTLHYLTMLGPKTILRVEGEIGQMRNTPPRSIFRYMDEFIEGDSVTLLNGTVVEVPHRWAQAHSGPDDHVNFDWNFWEVTLQHRALQDRLNIQLVHNEGLMERSVRAFVNSDFLRPNGTINAFWNGQELEENSRYTRLNTSYDMDTSYGFVRLIAGLRYDSVINTVEQKRDFVNLSTGIVPNRHVISVADLASGTVIPRFNDMSSDWQIWATNVQEFEVTGGYLALHGEFLDQRLNVQGGIRYDENRVQTFPNDSKIPGQLRPEYTVDKDGKRTSAFGFVYEVFEGIGLFANYGESYNMTLRRDFQDRFLPPRTTRGYDAGFKFKLFEDRLTGSLYGFMLDNRNNFEVVPNQLLPDDAPPGGAVSTDDESKGVGLDFTANPTPQWSIRGGYGYVDVYRTRGRPDVGVPENQTVQGHARHNANLFTRYNFREGVLRGFAIGGGINYQSRVVAGYLDTTADFIPDTEYSVSGYTQVDLLFAYSRRIGDARWNINLNVRNVFNTTYINPLNINNATRATPRSFLITSNLRF